MPQMGNQYAIGPAVMLSLVVLNVPANVFVNDVQTEAKYLSGIPTTRKT